MKRDGILEYKRLDSNSLALKAKRLYDRAFGRIMEDVDLEYVETRDLELLAEASKTMAECVKFTEGYDELVNYQTKVIEEMYRGLVEITSRMDNIEGKLDTLRKEEK